MDLSFFLLFYSNEDQERSSAKLDSYDTLVKVRSDGQNFWGQSMILRSSCIIDVRNFPYDDHSCDMEFGSWSQDTTRIDINSTVHRKTEYFMPNGEWDLLDVNVKKLHYKYACCEGKFAVSKLTLDMRRSTESYSMNIVIPSGILAGLSLLTYILPPESGERMSLGISILLAVTVFQQLTAEQMPKYGAPFLGQFFFITIIITSLSLVATTVILNIYHRTEQKMSPMLRVVVLVYIRKVTFCEKVS